MRVNDVSVAGIASEIRGGVEGQQMGCGQSFSVAPNTALAGDVGKTTGCTDNKLAAVGEPATGESERAWTPVLIVPTTHQPPLGPPDAPSVDAAVGVKRSMSPSDLSSLGDDCSTAGTTVSGRSSVDPLDDHPSSVEHACVFDEQVRSLSSAWQRDTHAFARSPPLRSRTATPTRKNDAHV